MRRLHASARADLAAMAVIFVQLMIVAVLVWLAEGPGRA